MAGLPGGKKKFEDTFSGVYRIPACVRRTDGQTDRHLATA